MEGIQNPTPPSVVPRQWWPGWNSEAAVTKFQIEIGGPLHRINPGKRLIEPGGTTSDVEIKQPDQLAQGEVWVVPRPRIYGSEELSHLAPAVAELIPEAVVTMHPDLSSSLGLSEGQTLAFKVEGQEVSLPIKLDDSIAADTITVPASFPETLVYLSRLRLI